MKLKRLRHRFAGVPFQALTATATPRVREGIIAALQLQSPLVIAGSVNRSNIAYEVRFRSNIANLVGADADTGVGEGSEGGDDDSDDNDDGGDDDDDDDADDSGSDSGAGGSGALSRQQMQKLKLKKMQAQRLKQQQKRQKQQKRLQQKQQKKRKAKQSGGGGGGGGGGRSCGGGSNEAEKHAAALQDVVRFITGAPNANASGIVYCYKRRTVEDVACALQAAGLDAIPYHGGIDAARRRRAQQDWTNSSSMVMVATVAFGMGIDKVPAHYLFYCSS